jgi:hypothetical protein
MGMLYLLPEDVTSWDKKKLTFQNIFGKWWDNVKAGPVMDDDHWYWNYLAHPYWGGIYYTSARSLGHSPVYCVLDAAAMSTFLWEYGFEALAEIPSIQDLIVTPLGGAVVGELFYLAKREIVKNNYKLLGTKFIGYPVAFLIDPANEIVGWFKKDKNNNTDIAIFLHPNVIKLTLKF